MIWVLWWRGCVGLLLLLPLLPGVGWRRIIARSGGGKGSGR